MLVVLFFWLVCVAGWFYLLVGLLYWLVCVLWLVFAAGCFAVIPNAPGDVVRSVVQKKLFQDPSRAAYGVSIGGVREHIVVAQEIVASSGVKGLYTGFAFKALHLGGSGALMAMFIPFFSECMGIQYGGV